MPFYRADKTNRSQHNLVGSTVDESSPAPNSSGVPLSPAATAAIPSNPSTAAGSASASIGAATNPSALSNPAFSSSESFQVQVPVDNNSQTTPQPPPHLANIYNNPSPANDRAPTFSQLQHSNTVTGAIDSRHRDTTDYSDQVTRSQSHRYTQQQISPTNSSAFQQQQLQFQQQQQLQQQQQPQQHQQQPQQHQQQPQQHQQQQQLSPRHQQQNSQQFSPQQQHHQQPFGATSIEDLSAVTGSNPNFSPPLIAQSHQHLVGQQHRQDQPLPQPPKKQSTRKLIKNILSGSSSSKTPESPHHHSNSHGYHSSLDRRSSKRVSQPPPPPSIRTGVSQISLEQQSDWQPQGPSGQPSPLQGSGEFRDQYIVNPEQELHRPNPQESHHPTIRPVPPSDSETSPYSADDLGYRQQSHLQPKGNIPPEVQHQRQQYRQSVFDPSQQQEQYQQFAHQQLQLQQQQQQQQIHYQGGNQPVSAHLTNPQQQNAETISQLSRESPVHELDQRSITNVQPPQSSSALNYPPQAQGQDIPVHHNPPSGQVQSPQQQQQQQNMAPPTGGPPPPRRSQETEKVQPPPGPPPSYRQSQQPNMNPLPQPPSAVGQNPNFRQGPGQDRQQYEGPGDIQGRNSPQPSTTADRGGEDPEKAFKELVTKYKNVKRLYFDGKKEIEQLTGQVEQLQNAIANQRMSQSRTSLDDSEYTTRFNRLNGAITNLSFNIRKDWVTLPSWLVPFVSADAIKTGKQEMTAVGRAVITRWVVEEIFNRCFHPGLEPELSRQLKTIEHNIRHFSYTMNSQEEFDALTNKVVNWRMATLEGLQDVLRSGESANHRADFTRRATSNLTACLFQHLTDPPPAGVDGSASMIVELAVGIASNLPLESRDVAIVYPLPEQQIMPEIMEVEKAGLPALETRSSDASEESAQGDEGAAKDAKDRRGDKSRAAGSSAPSVPPKDSGKVRFAGFVGVEVRGRHILVKAPVWTL